MVIDADEVAREVTRAGSGVFNSIVRHFGEEILGEDGAIDRRTLGKIVFSDPDELKVLNRLTHGPIIAKIKNRLRKLRGELGPEHIVVVEAPLLIETGLTSTVELVIVVVADEGKQVERLKTQGFSINEALARIRAQMIDEDRLEFADHLIENNGSLDELEAKARSLLEKLAAAN